MDCYKKGFKSTQEAYEVIRRNKGRKYRTECRVYKCEVCGEWHTTSKKKKRREKN